MAINTGGLKSTLQDNFKKVSAVQDVLNEGIEDGIENQIYVILEDGGKKGLASFPGVAIKDSKFEQFNNWN